jgi:hypothetical protein
MQFPEQFKISGGRGKGLYFFPLVEVDERQALKNVRENLPNKKIAGGFSPPFLDLLGTQKNRKSQKNKTNTKFAN